MPDDAQDEPMTEERAKAMSDGELWNACTLAHFADCLIGASPTLLVLMVEREARGEAFEANAAAEIARSKNVDELHALLRNVMRSEYKTPATHTWVDAFRNELNRRKASS